MVSVLEVFVIYKQPSDYPHSFVLRRQVAMPDGSLRLDPCPLAVALASHAAGLAAVRLGLPERGLVRMERQPDDDPAIYEVWI